MSKPDTNQASELYELCKEVYERTEWKQEPDISYLYKYWDNHDELCVISIEEAGDALIPAYTSDYLLEKLPVHLKEGTLSSLYELDEDGRPWCWGYHYDDKRVKLANGYYAQGWADTPLKALLNLVIKLDKGGVKL